MGVKTLTRIHPWSEPRTLRESGGKPTLTFRAGADNILAVRTEVGAAAETTRFRAEHRAVQLARRNGNLARVYPYGTYAARLHRGAPVQPEPDEDAILAKPGPTLEEVKVELARSRGNAPAGAERDTMLDAVRDALSDEASALVRRDDIELCRKVPIDPPQAEPGDIEVRHRFDPKSRKKSAAKRIVTLRDRRRGRPRRSGEKRHGSEPPT